MKLPQSWTTVTTLSKILALAMFVGLPFIGFYFGNKYSSSFQKINNKTVDNFKPLTITPTPILKTEFSNVFLSQKFGYKITIPSGWKGEITYRDSYDVKNGEIIYRDIEGDRVSAYSPDFFQVDPIIGKGAIIEWSVHETKDTEIMEKLKSDSLWNELAFNIKKIKFHGVDAVQYEYMYEVVKAVDTQFIYDGNIYSIKLDYSGDKSEFLKEYQAVLNSFEFKK